MHVCVCVCVCVLHLCEDTHRSPRRQLKQNAEEILIKALCERGGLVQCVCGCVCVCVCVCVWGGYSRFEPVSEAW